MPTNCNCTIEQTTHPYGNGTAVETLYTTCAACYEQAVQRELDDDREEEQMRYEQELLASQPVQELPGRCYACGEMIGSHNDDGLCEECLVDKLLEWNERLQWDRGLY